MSVKLSVGDIFIEVDGDNANVTVGNISINTYNNHTVINENTNYITNNTSSRKIVLALILVILQ